MWPLPTPRETADYLHRRQPLPAGVRHRPAARSPAPVEPSPSPPGPELVLALDRAGEFPRLIDEYEEGWWQASDLWRIDCCLDLWSGARVYRCRIVAAADREGALRELVANLSGVVTVTVYAIRRPPTFQEVERIEAANQRIEQLRRRLGPIRTGADLARQVGHLLF
jgi:hypothetical protein